MPPADNTPDFDSMSPEELMAWMESLAKRQGATEGLTTAADMEIAEIDPSTVEIDEPGYVPYGMEPEKWKAQQEAEAAAKAAKKAAAPAPMPEPVKPAPEPEIEFEPEPVFAEPKQPAAVAGTPDFDSMSPEELMAWMESLAKRQGATEGLTTAADMEIAEIDPSTVEIDEPGYVPYGMEPEQWKVQQEKEAAAKAARKAAAPAPKPEPVKPAPAPRPEPVKPAPEPEPEPEIEFEPEFDMADLELPSFDFAEELDTVRAEPASIGAQPEDDSLSWLESLAADQPADIPQMNLSSLGAEIEPLAAHQEDPMTWLESLAQGEEDVVTDEQEEVVPEKPRPPRPMPAAPPVGQVVDPVESGVDPVAWLESLAKRQGVSSDELVTSADLDIPLPESPADHVPGYTDYSFEKAFGETELPEPEKLRDKPPLSLDFEASGLDDPEAWLESLAESQGFDDVEEKQARQPAEEEEEEDIIAALNKGAAVSPEDMQAWMEQQFDRAEEYGDEEEIPDVDAPPVKAELPDWLLEQMGTPPEIEETTPEVKAELPDLEEIARAATEDMPDWLQSDTVEALETESIPDWLAGGEPQEAGETPPLVEEIAEPEMEAEALPDWLNLDEQRDEVLDGMPDWLVAGEPEDTSIEGIFAQVEEETSLIPTPIGGIPDRSITEELRIDTSDPWVDAFEQERTLGLGDMEKLPEWYAQRLDEPAAATAGAALKPAAFEPERELVEGEEEPLPDWLAEAEAAVDVEAVAAPGEMPDWLREQAIVEQPAIAEADDLPAWLKEAEVEPAEVPTWLMDTLATDEQQVVRATEKAPAPPPVKPAEPKPPVKPKPAEPKPAVSPAPVLAVDAKVDIPATLQSARTRMSGGDIDQGLQDYETVVRANDRLDDVVNDLNTLLKDKAYKENPAIHRVLGDGLMRQGRLQEALDTYRKALNLL